MQCVTCNRMFIGVEMIDITAFNNVMKTEARKRGKGFILKEIHGPMVLLHFKLKDRNFFLFGEDHRDQNPDYNAQHISDIRQNGLMFAGNSRTAMYIERLMFILLGRQTKRSKGFFFEIMANSTQVRPIRTMKEDVKKHYTDAEYNRMWKSYFSGLWDEFNPIQEIGKDHLKRLLRIFEEPLNRSIYNIPIRKNAGVYAVDYRNGNIENGIGGQLPDYVCHYSLFYRLIDEKKYKLADSLFGYTSNPEWDTQLLQLTLFDGTGKFKIFADEFKDKFDSLIKMYPNDVDLKYFSYLPGIENTSLSYNDHGISLQAELFHSLDVEHEVLIRNMCFVKCKSIDMQNIEERHDEIVDRISYFDTWFMDVPAFAKMLTGGQDDVFGYFGANHVENMLNMAATLDPYFTLITGSDNSVTLSPEIQVYFNNTLA